MSSMRLLAYLVLLGWLLLSGCRTEAPLEERVTIIGDTPTPAPRMASAATTQSATGTRPPPLQPTVIPTAPPTAAASPTADPELVIAVPPSWLKLTQHAIELLRQQGDESQWQVIATEEPDQLLAQSKAHAALIAGDYGPIVWEEALVVAVPFTADWEAITQTEAQEIASNGHSLATLMKWDEMPRNYRSLRIDGRLPDDAGYPLKQHWSLAAAAGFEMQRNKLLPAIRDAWPEDPLVQLAAVGDLMLDRSLGNAIRQGDLAYPFALVTERLAEADLTIGNLESALGDKGEPSNKSYTFRAPPQAAASLATAGFDVLSLANNHAMDFGPDALLQGIALLNAQGIVTVGAGSNSQEARQAEYLDVNDLTLAFLSYVNVPVEVTGFDTASWSATADTPGVAWGTTEQIRADVVTATGSADLVIVLLHSGLEYVTTPSEPQMAAARAAIDAGSQLVISHHSHILQGIEFYRDGVILYGIGNFAFQIDGDPRSAIFNIWLDTEGVRQIELVPTVIQFGGQPRIASADEAQAIRQQVYQLTALLNSQ